jgi:hypothetical protein
MYCDSIVPLQYSLSYGEWLSIEMWCNYCSVEDEYIGLLADKKNVNI